MTTLKQSQYLTVPSTPDKMFTVKTGSVEVYACTPKGSENYHKLFLAQLDKGECFFSPVKPQSPLEFQIFARADCVINDKDIGKLAGNKLAAPAAEWLHKLTGLPWIRHLIASGDETLLKWESKTIFGPDGDSSGDIAAICSDNLEKLSALIEGNFKNAEQNTDARTEMYGRYRDKALSGARRNLLREEFDFAGDGVSAGYADDPVKFVVCAAAGFLGMDTANISLPADVTANMDSVTKMRRLIRKANMEVRLVSLSEGWHKKDGGTFIGFLGEENTPAALLSKGSKKYVLVNEEHPAGLTVDDKTASKIKKDAFMCYAGLPRRKLKRKDMFSFMFRHTMKHDWAAIWLVSFAAGLLPILIPLITETIFRDVIPINDRQALGTVTQVMLVSGVTTAILGFVRSISLLRVKSHVGVAFESALWSRLLSLPASFFRDYETGNLVGRMQGVAKIT
ncbi:MAG: ABC transporter transmembrane domain-containing protein, partial [Synergistaceae bacterium]|nr:ABC transporter transmembrane domain-containing protein [Synergistaceae bacterium]